MKSSLKVLALGGSPRVQGNTNYLIDQALEEIAARGIATEKVVLNQYKIGPCQAHGNCREVPKCLEDDDGVWILEKFSQADGVILASPVYFGSVSAQMKTFLDRTFFLFTHGRRPKARCFGLIVLSGRGSPDEALRELGKFAGPPGSSQAEVFTVKGAVGGPGRHVRDLPELVQAARDLGRQMAEVLSSPPV